LGCGYKPSSVYQDNILGNEIKAKVKISAENPRETIFLKDAINDAVYSSLGKNLCYDNCKTVIDIISASSSLTPIYYDENGYPVIYRMEVNIKAKITDKNGRLRIYSVNGSYDFKVESNSILTDQIKLEAYKKASINALNKLFAKLTKDGAYYDN